MDVVPRLIHTELLLTGLFQCAGVLLDRFVENGLLERLEIDSALQAVEDGATAVPRIDLCMDEDTRRYLALPAHILRIMNEKSEAGKILTTRQLCEILSFDANF